MRSLAAPVRLPPPTAGRVDLLVVAGEHSGDEHAARMIRGFLALRPGARVAALGGPRLAEAGAQLLLDLTAISSVGYAEVLRNYRSFYRPLFLETVRWIAEHGPLAVCGVDYGGFNMRLADELRARALSVRGGGRIRTLHYISPQIWASRAGRRFRLARALDALAVIFPFEPACYADTDLCVDFVGHPFVAPDYSPPVHYDPAGPVLLLPGSRRQAVRRIAPSLFGAFAQFSAARADARGVVIYPSPEIRAVLEETAPPDRVALRAAGEGSVGASAVLMSSGTMSMHCALAGIPGAVVYRADPLTYALGRLLVRVRHLGIANLVLGEEMYPEFIQGAARPDRLAEELASCAQDPGRRQRTATQGRRLREMLSGPARGDEATWLAEKTADAVVLN